MDLNCRSILALVHNVSVFIVVVFDLHRYNPDDQVEVKQEVIKEDVIIEEKPLPTEEPEIKDTVPVPNSNETSQEDSNQEDNAIKIEKSAENNEVVNTLVEEPKKVASPAPEPQDLNDEQVKDVLGKLPSHILPPDVVCTN